jgi:hypothetical protein
MSSARLVALVAALSLSLPALAQQPQVIELGPPGAATSAAKYVYATKDVTARRWQDAETPSTGEVKTNDRLELVFKTDGWVRVRMPKSPKFGWLPADAVTETAPPGAEPPPGGGLDSLSPELQKMIQEKMKELGQPGAGAPEQ